MIEVGKRMRWLIVVASLGLLILLSNAKEAGAANFDVTVAPMNTLTFGPATRFISPGDTVTWNWSAENTVGHTTTECGTDGVCVSGNPAPNAIWDSSPAQITGSFGPVTFNTAGTFNYRCNIHPLTMKGSIIVGDPAGDADGDTVPNGIDNCVLTPNLDQLDTDDDGEGDVCDDDDDNDGLSDLNEIFFFGTDPLNPDTDGDGLSDGDEVFLHFTNPLVADTDGDSLGLGDPFGLFFRDGVEVFMGTLPLIACAATSTPDDEDPDALGPDWDDSKDIDGSDVFLFAERFGSQSGIPPPFGKLPYIERFDIYPTGVSLNKIDGSDVFVLATYFGATCI